MSTTDEIMKLATECEDAATVLESYLMNADAYETQLSTYDKARAALLKAVEALASDAARYRFLRLNYDDSLIMYGDNSHCEMMMTEELDRAIDAARAALGEKS